MGLKQRYNPITNELNLVDEHEGTATVVVGGADNDIVQWNSTANAYQPTDEPTVDKLVFDLTAAATLSEGEIGWDVDNGTLSLGMPGGTVKIQIGQESVVRAKNAEAVQIDNGQAVYIFGGDGSNATIKLASNTSLLTSAVLGVATENIPASQFGYATSFGLVRNIDTDSEALDPGDWIWLGTSGDLIKTRPTAPTTQSFVGICLRRHVTGGVIIVRPSLVQRLQTLSDVYTASIADGDVIKYVTANSRFENIIGPETLTGEPTGFTSPEDVVMNYDSTARTVTLTGTVNAYYRGVQVAALTSGWVSDAHPVTLDKEYFLVYNGSAFEWIDLSGDALDFKTDLFITYVHHGTAYKWSIRECHGLMPWQSHKEMHEVIGTYKNSGGTLGDYTLSSTTAADRRPSVSSSVVYDEDLPSTITALAAGSYSQYFLSSTDTANFTLAAADIVPLSTNQPYWNEFTGGAWQQTLMSNNYYMPIWVVQIPTTADAGSLSYRTLFLQGQSEHATLAATQGITPNNHDIGELGSLLSEFVYIAKVIIRYQGGNWTLISVDAITGTRFSQASSPTGTYLSAVETDATLTGIGTVGDPLIVAIPSITTVTQAATDTLIAAEVTNSVINNYGQAAENTQTLPTAAANMNFIAVVGTSGTGAFHIKAGPTDKIYLDGTALDDGDKASLATPAVGDSIVFFSFQTGASTYDWIAQVITGTWTDGGA